MNIKKREKNIHRHRSKSKDKQRPGGYGWSVQSFDERKQGQSEEKAEIDRRAPDANRKGFRADGEGPVFELVAHMRENVIQKGGQRCKETRLFGDRGNRDQDTPEHNTGEKKEVNGSG